MTNPSDIPSDVHPVSTSPVPVAMTTVSFSVAMAEVALGKMVTRQEWGNKDEYGLLKDGWLMIHHAGKPDFFIWKVSEGDMVGTDWEVIVNN